jgi:hypothetical protein
MFSKKVSFQDVSFQGRADFGSDNDTQLEFNDEAAFSGAHFGGQAIFRGSHFRGDAQFAAAAFDDNAFFDADPKGESTSYKNEEYFYGAKFNSVSIFDQTRFL